MAPFTRPQRRSSLIGYLMALGLLLSFGAACLFLAVHQHVAWLVIVAIVVLNGVWMVQRYAQRS